MKKLKQELEVITVDEEPIHEEIQDEEPIGFMIQMVFIPVKENKC